MWTSRWIVLATLTLAPACGDDPTAVCSGSEPAHLLQRDDLWNLTVTRAGDRTFLHSIDGSGTPRVFAGAACGAEPVPLYDGIQMSPFLVREDPATDDPTIVCTPGGALFRVDLDGDAVPTLFMPNLSCAPRLLTDHGLVLIDRSTADLWLFPDFPELASARRIPGPFDPTVAWHATGSHLYYGRLPDELRLHDLVTGADTPLLTGVASFDATATHVLWREVTDAEVAPMRLLDRATGTSTYLGLYRRDEDEYGAHNRGGHRPRPWSLAPGGSYVLHVPYAAYAPMAAHDFDGRTLEFPAWGSLDIMLADGTAVVLVGDTHFAVRPDGVPLALDFPRQRGNVQAVGDHLETLTNDELHHIPLDGSPSHLIARGVGRNYAWIDGDRLLTLVDYALLTIDPATTHRSRLAYAVTGFDYIPGEGVYYSVASSPGHSWNGIWYLPQAGLRPAPPRCIYFEACTDL